MAEEKKPSKRGRPRKHPVKLAQEKKPVVTLPTPDKRDQIIEACWKRGLLKYKLRDYQHVVYDATWNAITTKQHLKYVINCARRFGKTTILLIVALEYAIRFKESQIRFACPTAKQLRKIIFPILKMLTRDCPEHLKPTFRGQDDVYVFPNGSEIHLAGTDSGHAESLRGTASHLNIVDEAGSCDQLHYVVHSILMPQTITTQGITLLASTPAVVVDHDYTTIAHECKEKKAFIQFDVYANTSIDEETLNKYIEESGGKESTTFRREYLCAFVTDTDLLIIPEWKPDYIKETVKDEYYPFYHKYDAMDIGVRDFTAVLFGYYDFRNAKLVVEDEYTINGPEMTTDFLAEQIKDKEIQLWNTNKLRLRIADNNNLILLQDLTTLHGLSFAPTNKDQLEAMVNEVRIWVKQGKVEINPRCERLAGCLQHAIWKKDNGRKVEFARSSIYGHYDHLAALIYLIRNIDVYTNPIPPTYGLSHATHFISKNLTHQLSSEVNNLSKALKKRR